MSLENKVALITGAGSGIGAAAAKLYAQQKAKVALLGRTEEELNDVKNDITKGGGEAIVIIADISKPEDMQKAIDKTVSEWGTIDVLFANAGINGTWAPIEDLTPDDWDKTLDINLKGTFLTVKYAVPYLKKKGGSVIVTSSVNGTRMFSNTGATAYACSKAAQVAFVKMIAVELGEYGIRVNVICPGAIETSIDENTQKEDLKGAGVEVEYPEGKIPLTGGKPGSSEQVAQLVAFLGSDASSHISGTEVWIDGAQSLLQG
jgi:NAD(P)-dependent dehydrogenase (short-subunit alcohol dehydrogenase family)